ncbi:MAG: transporter [Deltaproteobacteria bacterium]|jgi:hypothetical protein|nr:transporter [Deltaproteobacteria bacterium]
MKCFVSMILGVVFFVLSGSGAALATKGHHSPGSGGVLAATMPPTGSYYKLYNTFYSTDSYRGNDGKETVKGLDTDAFVFTTRFIHVYDFKLLGADPLSDIVIPVQYMSSPNRMTGGRDNNISLGDTLVQPLYLAWHGARWDAVFGPGVYIPIGSTGAHGAGKGYWSWIAGGGATVYFTEAKDWHFSFVARLEDHIKDTAAILPGMAFHVEGGLGKRVNKNVTLGIAGTAYRQLTKDSGPGSVSLKYSSYSLGPEFRYNTPSGMSIECRYLFEAEVKNGTKGRTFFVNLSKAF